MSILETFYVWLGRGSLPAEQAAARVYAMSLAPSPEAVLELTEEEGEAAEMFWAILGDGDYARADYWKWRTEPETVVDPRVWAVNVGQKDAVSRHHPSPARGRSRWGTI